MQTKDLIIGGLTVWVLYLLNKSKQQTNLQEIDLSNNAVISIDGSGLRNYHATVYSANPLKAIYVPGTKGDGQLTIGLQGKVDADYIPQYSQIKGIKNINCNKIPCSF